MAAEGAICVVAESIVPTDGFIVAFIYICEPRACREVSTTLIFTASICTTDFQTASINTALLFQNKHHYQSDQTITTDITAIITCQKQCTDETIHFEGFQTLLIQGDFCLCTDMFYRSVMWTCKAAHALWLCQRTELYSLQPAFSVSSRHFTSSWGKTDLRSGLKRQLAASYCFHPDQ